MRLEAHDNDPTGNTLCARVEVDYPYQVEMYVVEIAEDAQAQVGGLWVVRWSLFVNDKEVARWERPPNDPGTPKLIWTTPEAGLSWRVGT
jgi:hypothetical protein